MIHCKNFYKCRNVHQYNNKKKEEEKARPYLKNNLEAKRVGEVAQVIEHLPSKQEALS
jgi:hypothetical protein